MATRRLQRACPAPDLAGRDSPASGPNQPWVADVTFIPTATGFLILAVAPDAWSRKVIGWSMASRLRSGIVAGTPSMALGQGRLRDVIICISQASRYASPAFGNRCREAGYADGDAMCEGFLASLECDLLAHR